MFKKSRLILLATILLSATFGSHASCAESPSKPNDSYMGTANLPNATASTEAFGESADPNVLAARIAETSGRHGDAMHYYSQAALHAPYVKSGTANNYKAFYLRKALFEGDAAQPANKTELTNVMLRLADELRLYEPEEADTLYKRAFALIPDSNSKKDTIAFKVENCRQIASQLQSQKRRTNAQAQLMSSESNPLPLQNDAIQGRVNQELRSAEVARKYKHKTETLLWSKLATDEANNARLDDAYTHAKKCIESYQPQGNDASLSFYALYRLLPVLTKNLSERNAERLYKLAIEKILSTRSSDKRNLLITRAQLFQHYIHTNQFSKATHYLIELARGSGRELNITRYEISAFKIIERTISGLSEKNADEAVKLQKQFIACEKLELPADHQRFVSLLEELAWVEKAAGHKDDSMNAYAESIKLDFKYNDTDADVAAFKISRVLSPDRNVYSDFNYDALLGDLKQTPYGMKATFVLRQQLRDYEKSENWSEADKAALKLCDIVEHQDDTHAGRQVGCEVTGPEWDRISTYIDAIKARVAMGQPHKGIQIVKRAVRNLPDLTELELEQLANASIDCKHRVLATKLADSSQNLWRGPSDVTTIVDLPALWKRLNHPNKVT